MDRTTIREWPDIYEPERYEYARVLFMECSVAGLSFHVERNDELWDELSVGTKIALVRDRNNKHDRNAVAIALADDYDGDPDNFDFDYILGYIPRTENAVIATMLDAGYFDKFDAEITSFKRHGSYEERIRITIWLTTYKPIKIRPHLLRADCLDHQDFLGIIESLKLRGVAYYRLGGFPLEDYDLPEKGEQIIMYTRLCNTFIMYFMKVLAVGDDCEFFFEDPSDIHCCDDCVPYILGNVAGPISVTAEQLSFIPERELERLSPYHYLVEPISKSLIQLFKSNLRLLSNNNVDADPSIDAAKEEENLE